MKLPEELQFLENAYKVQKTSGARMDGRVVVITGATSGVGYEAAKRFAQGGAHLVMVCRNGQKAGLVRDELAQHFQANVDVVIADFAKFNDVKNAAERIRRNYHRVDVLINNAGVHFTHRTLNENGIEMVFAVNHLASFLFTQLLMDILLNSAPARIIQVNSQGHRFGGLDVMDLNWEKRRYKGLQAYGASKVAQLLTVWEFADRLEGSGVTINAMHPGEVRTNIGMNNKLLYRLYKRYALWWVLRDPVVSGESIYYLAADPEMEEINGRFFNLTIDEKPAAHALDRGLGKQVWHISNNITGLSGLSIIHSDFNGELQVFPASA